MRFLIEILKTNGRSRFRLAALFLGFLLSSCVETSRQDIIPELDVSAPLGVQWDPTPDDLKTLASRATKSCNKMSDISDEDLGGISDDPLAYLSKCLEISHHQIHLDNVEPLGGHSGDDFAELGLAAIDPAKPIMLTYHYRHSLSATKAERADREAQADIIRDQLRALYGRPTSRGRFSEYGKTLYSKSALPAQPCDFWVVGNVGVFLCSERVILLDGVEMSLSYIRLDRAEFGKELFLEVANKRRQRPEHHEILSQENVIPMPHERSEDDIIFEHLMSGRWLQSSRFETCKKPDLEKLEDRINAAQDLKPIFTETLASLEGEELAMYYFENQEELDDRAGFEKRKDVSLLFINEAVKMGSPAAMNELGAAQLYCYFGVKQDVRAAQSWLEKASDGGDPHAMLSMARLHLGGLTAGPDARSKARQLLEACDDELVEECGDLKRRLNEYESRE